MASPSLCVECSRRLRDAIFCPHCKGSACCWECYVAHYSGQHALTGSFPALKLVDYPDSAIIIDQPDAGLAHEH